MYRDTESLCCALETTYYYMIITLQKQTNKLIFKKRSDLWLPVAGSEGKRNWMKAVKRYKLPVII